MNKLAKLIQGMSKEEIMLLNKDLIAGNLNKVITKRMKEFEVDYSEKFCPVCGGEIGEDSYVLEFGKSYLRKRAHFDGIDCLSYFINSKKR